MLQPNILPPLGVYILPTTKHKFIMPLESSELYTIGWITALPTERAAAIALLNARYRPPTNFIQHPSDINSYS